MGKRDKKKKHAKAGNPGPKPNEPTEPRETEMLSDGWVTLLILSFLACVCILSWWLTQREGIGGAPGAPVGCISTNKHPFFESPSLSKRHMDGERSALL